MPEGKFTVHSIRRAVAGYYGLDPETLMANRTVHSPSAVPRQMVMYLARELTSHSYPALGRILERDHTTVMHGVETTRWRMAKDPKVATAVDVIRRRLAA